MKRFYSILFSLLTLSSLSVTAQTMYVQQGNITTAIAASAEAINYTEGGSSISVSDLTFPVNSIDLISFQRSPFAERTLSVYYLGDDAIVTVSGDIASKLTIKVMGAHVSVLAAPTLQEEVHYILSGNSSNGSFWMDGEYKASVTLDNLTLTNPDSAAICIENGKRIAVNVPTGTETTLADGANGPQDACFFVNGHAEFKGGGTLRVSGQTKHAYASDEYTQFKADFGRFEVISAVNDGLHIKQYLQVNGGDFVVKGTGGDCFDVSTTKDPTDEENGNIIIKGGTFDLEVAADDVKGIKSDNQTTISGGTIKALVSGLGTKGISVGTDLLINQASGVAPLIQMTVSGTTYMPGDEELESKCRGIKVKGDFTLDGGQIEMTVTGEKAKAISVDGKFTHLSGTTSHLPS